MVYGTRAAMVLDGPIDGHSVSGFCEWLLAPSLYPGDLVVIDNLSSHKSLRVVQAIEAVRASAVYLPTYSPDLNPIDNVFSQVKQLIRGIRPRRFQQIIDAVKQVLPQTTLDDLELMFLHCGYGIV